MNKLPNVSDKIMGMVAEGSKTAKLSAAPIPKTAHLYSDLGYDSLSFVRLLLEIEVVFAIRFELYEMSACLWADRLVAIVEQKVRYQSND